MLPTLTLGIPGNAPAAALLAALQLKDVILGPTIEVDQPGLVAFIYALLIIANIMTWFAALLLIKPCVKLFMLRRELLLALVIPICVIGAFSVRNNMFDVWIMLAGGFAGYFFHLFPVPLPDGTGGARRHPRAARRREPAPLDDAVLQQRVRVLRPPVCRPRAGAGDRGGVHGGPVARMARAHGRRRPSGHGRAGRAGIAAALTPPASVCSSATAATKVSQSLCPARRAGAIDGTARLIAVHALAA
jgi:hypothetical protein